MKFTLALAFVLLTSTVGWADLTPDEVAIVAMRESPQSLELARYYSAARGIPEEHIFQLPGRPADAIGRQEWEANVAPAIRRWLEDSHLDEKVRCLVTTWDVPLKIGQREIPKEERSELDEALTHERHDRVQSAIKIIKALDAVFPAANASSRPDISPTVSLRHLAEIFDRAFHDAQARIGAQKEGRSREQALNAIKQMFLSVVGLNTTLRAQLKTSDTSKGDDSPKWVELAKGQLEGLTAGLAALQALPESIERDQQILLLIDKTDGLLGSVQWVDQYLALLKGNETYSSFDSELSLLFWSSYPLLRWQANPLNYLYDGSDLRRHRRTLMVSRLEAPTFELAKKLIDAAVATEKTGLKGKFYIDARGIAFDNRSETRGSYGDYDESLRNLARLLKEHTRQEVVLDDKPELFQPGKCPDAALYCGWYSLAPYVDAFVWQPGAVAYHASSESTSPRDPQSQAWCKKMLEKGVGGTLGPVYEPYLAAFPRPDDFFPLLLSGRYTLVETYYRSLPFNSWVMVLVGDPLYNPFKNHPAFGEDRVPAELQRLLGPGK